MRHTLDRPAHALLLISFPHQLLHALSALKYYRLRQGIPDQTPAIIFAWAYQSSHHAQNSAFRRILNSTICDFPFIKLVFPTWRERFFNISPYRTLINRVGWVRSKLCPFSIDAIFFAHDASADRTSQVLMQSFPEAEPICFGDPPGFLYPQFHSQYQSNILKRLFWSSRTRGTLSMISPVLTFVSIDFYNNHNAVDGNVLIVPREIITDTLTSLQRVMEKVKKDLNVNYEILLKRSSCINILLLSNFSESGLAEENNELALYGEICKEFKSPYARLLIKPHFGTKPDFMRKLAMRLSSHDPVFLSPIEAQIPIEFFPELIRTGNIISVSSSSALLSHIYQKKISHALTANRIRKYFQNDKVAYMLEANQAIDRFLSLDIEID